MNSVLFLPLQKADAKQRTVSGIAVSEVADRSGEIFDYATSKPLFQTWSNEAHKASGGKSLGNVRGMHKHVAAGKLTSIDFNDRDRAIEVTAKIVDDAEWQKVESGVYTGFSIGGAYVRTWTDDSNLKRYTAQPSEISLVDSPCVPSATFTMIKRDGSRELRQFQQHDPALVKAAAHAAAARAGAIGSMDGAVSHTVRDQMRGLEKQDSLSGADRLKTVFGAVGSITHGILFVQHQHDADGGSLDIHGHQVRMSELGRDLRDAIYSTAAAFNRAETQQEQVNQSRIVGLLVTEAMRRDARLSDKVREIKAREK
ncbi:hypothetical protein [Bradyrhizobium tropiciagri]|uniref:hypothetical protein n=1 Tax=Bradyrhizobium tropiciagri TaxID=312253 RepID=UPI00067C202F|nr:hypothetical protein [Bradyrhizobium tropiciagri]